MLRKKEVYTHITPIPAHIPRQLALDILHSHGEIITLNPLVLDYKPVKAPRDAAADEYYSTWYEITERIQYLPGIGNLGSGKINFKGCFHDMPWGVQTHVFAPMNVELRNNWRVAGNQPGEPQEARELGIGAPAEGLYLREDIEIKCNITFVSFVKSQMKSSSKVLVDRLIKKAELLDAGVLVAMMEDGKLRTVNPADRSSPAQPQSQSQSQSPSTGVPYQVPPSPTMAYRQGSTSYRGYSAHPKYAETPPTTTMELPGDFYHRAPAHAQETSHLHPGYAYSTSRESTLSDVSKTSPDGMSRWSDYQSTCSSRPTSLASDTSGMRSPPLDHKGFASELPTMEETREEYDRSHAETLKILEARGTLEPDTVFRPS